MTVSVFVAGRPVPQGSKRHVGNGILVESAKGLAAWREAIAWQARAAAQKAGHRSDYSGPVVLDLRFTVPAPQRLPAASPIRRPDIDKLSRAVLDALTGVWYVDDSQVVSLCAHKAYATTSFAPGACISMTAAL